MNIFAHEYRLDNKHSIVHVHCDSNFRIQYVNKFCCKILQYEPDELIGEDINTIMPDNIVALHKEAFKRRSLDNSTKLFFEDALKTFILITKNDTCLNFLGKTIINDDMTTEMHLSLVEHIDSPLVPNEYMRYINNKASFHIKQYNNVCCLLLDMANSTRYANTVSCAELALLFHNLYKRVENIVLKYYFPYVVIHETCGDNFFLLVNSDKNCTQKCTSISLDCAFRVVIELNSFLQDFDESLYMRCGVSYGEIAAGVIDGKSFRAFGRVIHMASRLESECDQDQVAVDISVMDKLKTENLNICTNHNLDISMRDLKGFGETEVYIISKK